MISRGLVFVTMIAVALFSVPNAAASSCDGALGDTDEAIENPSGYAHHVVAECGQRPLCPPIARFGEMGALAWIMACI